MRSVLRTGWLVGLLASSAGCAYKQDDSATAVLKLCSNDKSCPGTLTCGKGLSDRAQCVERCARYGPGPESGCPEDIFCYVAVFPMPAPGAAVGDVVGIAVGRARSLSLLFTPDLPVRCEHKGPASASTSYVRTSDSPFLAGAGTGTASV